MIILLIGGLITGLFIFRDYGLSRDEPLFYAYADAIGYAYSIPEHLGGEFDIEQAYGPSATDHKMYGPAYLLVTRNLVNLLNAFTGIPRPEFWHLVNFLTFLVGGVLLYDLCKRWMSDLAAFSAVLLFIIQPVLWGHAFINPKDIPFMVFMLAALSLGLRMVDRLMLLTPPSESPSGTSTVATTREGPRKTWLVMSLMLGILLMLILFFNEALREGLRILIQDAYAAPSTSLPGWVFQRLAINAADVPVEAYIEKGLVQYDHLRAALLAIEIPLLFISLAAAFRPPLAVRTVDALKSIFAPLPTRPSWWIRGQNWAKILLVVLLPGILLGLVTSIRVTGPLVGFLVLLYFMLRPERRSYAAIGLYALIALVVSYLTWPFLWDAPVKRFIEVLRHMASNPHILPVLYRGDIFPSNELPASYLPVMLGITLTIPVLVLFFIGLYQAKVRLLRRQIEWRSLVVVTLLFLIFFFYVVLLSPPVYDGYRHFLFILPPVFILSGVGMQFLLERINNTWWRAVLLLIISVPGLYGLISNHPYQYTYYNALVGGTSGASRRFETDYWLTCYKDVMESHINPDPARYPALHVLRAPSIAAYYAPSQVKVLSFDPQVDQPVPGQVTLLTTRTNVDLSLLPDATPLFSVGLPGADFCVVKQSR